jgi:predicted nucleotide-binding protein (sugar kinase/HSP70/actin superfamily)
VPRRKATSFAFKDVDENKPVGSIKIRVETIAYFLERYRDQHLPVLRAEREIEQQLEDLERRLRDELAQPAGAA